MDQKEKGELQNRIRELEEQHQQLEREASEHEQRLESYNRQIQRFVFWTGLEYSMVPPPARSVLPLAMCFR